MSRLRIRSLAVAIAICAIVTVIARWPARVRPMARSVPASSQGSFTPHGEYPGTPLAGAKNVRMWGSWSGSDDNQGSLTVGPFLCPAQLQIALSGYPRHPGNRISIRLAGTSDRHEFVPPIDVGERWWIFAVDVPAAWVGKPILIEADDHATGLGGWLGVSEPLQVGGFVDDRRQLLNVLAAWLANGIVLGVLGWAAARLLAGRGWLPDAWFPLGVAGVVALAGYAAFWVFFANATAGRIFCWLLCLGAAFVATRRRATDDPLCPDLAAVSRLLLAIGLFYVALLCLFPSSLGFYDLAANRFRDGLPGDNGIPHGVATKLYHGETLRDPHSEWESSDRPPLQAGWQLLTMPLLAPLNFDGETLDGTAALWLQLLWVPAAFGFLRVLGLGRDRATAWVAVFAISGFFLQNTVYTWPKLSAAAFGCGAFALWVWPDETHSKRASMIVGAAFAGLAWLSHGGIAFSFIALLPWVGWQLIRGEIRNWALATLVFLALSAPWFAYQKLYDPPGDRLIKMHLAGVPERDPRGPWTVIRDSYRTHSWHQIVENKVENFRMLTWGGWKGMLEFDPATSKGRRDVEFFFTTRALTWWLLGAVVLPIAWVRSRSRSDLRANAARTFTLLAWAALTTVVWCVLMFGPRTTCIHQGSYASMLALFVVLSVFIEWTSPWLILLLAGLQGVAFATTWACSNGLVVGRATGWPILAITAAGLLALFARSFATDTPTKNATKSGWGKVARVWSSAAALWQRHETGGHRVVALLALGLLVWHKPWALRTPQLWAEDGSVFLNDADRLGLAAFLQPHQGYLHFIPRLVVWLSNGLADVAHWPFFYNLGALVVTAIVLLRMAAPRMQQPQKPWLILAFALVAQSGETLFNVTNVQWISAFLLIEQLLLQPAETTSQRVGDFICVVFAGLTGPFAVLLLPFFAWQAWRKREPKNRSIGAAVALCAVAQLWCLIRHPGNHTAPEPASFDFVNMIAVIGERLVVWPFLGEKSATELPTAALAGIGGAVIAAVGWCVWANRNRRRTNVPILLICAVLVASGLWRARAYGWHPNDISNGDRYFFIPRVLFAWLVIWQFDAGRRLVAVSARLLCLIGALLELPHHAIAAPPNYDWAAHCDPIRRGIPARISTLPPGWMFEYPGRPPPNR